MICLALQPTIEQLHLEQQADMLEIKEGRLAMIREDIMKGVLLGSEHVHAGTQGLNAEANQKMHEVSLLVNQYT